MILNGHGDAYSSFQDNNLWGEGIPQLNTTFHNKLLPKNVLTWIFSLLHVCGILLANSFKSWIASLFTAFLGSFFKYCNKSWTCNKTNSSLKGKRSYKKEAHSKIFMKELWEYSSETAMYYLPACFPHGRLYCSSMASRINPTAAFCYPPLLSAQAHFSAAPYMPQEAVRAIPALT